MYLVWYLNVEGLPMETACIFSVQTVLKVSMLLLNKQTSSQSSHGAFYKLPVCAVKFPTHVIPMNKHPGQATQCYIINQHSIHRQLNMGTVSSQQEAGSDIPCLQSSSSVQKFSGKPGRKGHGVKGHESPSSGVNTWWFLPQNTEHLHVYVLNFYNYREQTETCWVSPIEFSSDTVPCWHYAIKFANMLMELDSNLQASLCGYRSCVRCL